MRSWYFEESQALISRMSKAQVTGGDQVRVLPLHIAFKISARQLLCTLEFPLGPVWIDTSVFYVEVYVEAVATLAEPRMQGIPELVLKPPWRRTPLPKGQRQSVDGSEMINSSIRHLTTFGNYQEDHTLRQALRSLKGFEHSSQSPNFKFAQTFPPATWHARTVILGNARSSHTPRIKIFQWPYAKIAGPMLYWYIIPFTELSNFFIIMPSCSIYWSYVTRCIGLEFILQLCVEDDERAGTILAVSNKYMAHTSTLIHLYPETQVLWVFYQLRSVMA